MKSYNRIILGEKNSLMEDPINEQWFGGGWSTVQDLTNKFPDNFRDFNARFIPVYLESKPSNSKVAADPGYGMPHTIRKGIRRRRILKYQVSFKLFKGQR